MSAMQCKEITFFFKLILECRISLLLLALEDLDQSQTFIDLSLPPEIINLPFSPNIEKALTFDKTMLVMILVL